MKKYIISIAILLFIISSLYILISMFVSSKADLGVRDGTIKTSKQAWHIAPHGIAVDSSNNLYVGVPSLIMVFNRQGNFLHSYEVNTFATYSFTVDKSDNIVIARTRGQNTTVYNREGSLLTEVENNNNSKYKDLLRDRNVASTDDGVTYRLHNLFGYTQVKTSEGTLAYKIPLKLFLIKLAFPLAFISLAAILSWGAIKFYSHVYSYLGHNGGKQ